jgi:RNA polymerase sigma-70 factor (ECF subfamily)
MELISHLSAKAQEDFHWVQKAKVNDQQAFSFLMSRYKDSLYYTVFKMVQNQEDAEDLTIEAFSKAFSKLEAYTPQFAFSTWLFKIASNHCIDFLRKKRIKAISIHQVSKGEDGESYEIPVKDLELNPAERMQKNELIQQIRGVVDQLKPRYKRMIELRYFEEKSYEEIAQEMDLPLGTVKAQLFRARDLLQEIMKR